MKGDKASFLLLSQVEYFDEFVVMYMNVVLEEQLVDFVNFDEAILLVCETIEELLYAFLLPDLFVADCVEGTCVL